MNLLPDFERHFGLTGDQINAARDSQRCVVHHDDQGRIIDIEAAATQRDPQRLDSNPSLRIAA